MKKPDQRKVLMLAYRDEAGVGSVEWHLRTLEVAATAGLGRVPASTVRYHVRRIRAALKAEGRS